MRTRNLFFLPLSCAARPAIRFGGAIRFLTACVLFVGFSPISVADPDADTDGDGISDFIETFFANRDPNVPDSGSLFQLQNAPDGPELSFRARDDFEWPWRVAYSHDLTQESWTEVPGEFLSVSPTAGDPPQSQVTVTWQGPEDRVFFRVEVELTGPEPESIGVNAAPLTGAVVDDVNQRFFFSGIVGVNYTVILTPDTLADDPDLLIFESREDMDSYWDVVDANGGEDSEAAQDARLGKSDNPPGDVDSVSFSAHATQDYFIMLSGSEGETANYSLQVTSWAHAVPTGDPFEIELKDGQTTSTETLYRGADFTADDAPVTYEMELTVYDNGEPLDVYNLLDLNPDGTGTILFPEGEDHSDQSPLIWSIQEGSIVAREEGQWGDIWVWIFTRLDSGSTLIQVSTPPGQEDAADFAVIGSLEPLP